MLRRLLVLASALLGLLTFAGFALAASPGAATDTPDLTDDLGSWAALVGIGLPALVALLQRSNWMPWVRALIFGAACVIASIVYGWIRFGSDLSWAHWEGALLAIVAWGVATYHLYWARGGDQSVVNKLRRFP